VSGKRGSWLSRLKAGLNLTSASLGNGISSVFARGRLDDKALEELEELLILGDLGAATAADLTETIAKERFGRDVSEVEVRTALANEIAVILEPVAKPLLIERSAKPHVVLVAGVNGTGKTTTVGKLASQFRADDLTVMLAAADTFRAAAVDQLKIWGERSGSPVVVRDGAGGDPASLAYDALVRARAEDIDVLLIDTAGRLQNKANLMAELQKIDRVVKKLDERAPHTRLLVLDATTGQNAHSQVEIFRESVDIDGLIVTKLDGTAKGGVLVALAQRFGLPVFALGVGEAVEDLRPFEAQEFARALMNLNN